MVIIFFSITLRSPQHLLSNPDEIIKFFKWKRLDFITQYNNVFPNKQINYNELREITMEEAIAWKNDHLQYLINSNSEKALAMMLDHSISVSDIKEVRKNWTEAGKNSTESYKGYYIKEYIWRAYEKGGQKQAQAVFDKIKWLDKSSQMEATLKYDLDPIEVKNARCFPYGEEYILRAYEKRRSKASSSRI